VSGGVQRVLGNLVTTNYFDILGVRPALGRLFAADDEKGPGTTPIAVLSYRFWTRHFNADPSVLGQTLQLNGRAFMVVGIAPDGFRGTSVVVSDLWLPMTFASTLNPNGNTLLTSRESTWLMMGGRLKTPCLRSSGLIRTRQHRPNTRARISRESWQ
jgi:putative ABC transport system permease protein